MNKTMSSRPAYSLIFAFIMMTVIMVIATTTIQDTRNKIQLFGNLESSSQARLAAESAAELGIVALKNSPYVDGEEVADAFCLEDSSGVCQGSGNYTVYANAGENNNDGGRLYYLPIPGTGNAAPSDDCSILLDTDESIDHSCNWDKLIPGQGVTIPLYGDDGTFPDTMDLTGWYLRMRTPCEDGSIESDCDGGDRYVISTVMSFYTSTDNPAIVLWEFTGETSSGSVSILPSDMTRDGLRSYETNTEIYEGLIQNVPYSSLFNVNDVVLGAANVSYAGYKAIYDFIRTSGYTNLIFNMSIINALEDTSGNSIPYLEYQIVLDSSLPSIAPRAEIIGKGYYESGGDTYFSPYVISTNNIDAVTTVYTLSN